MPFIFPGQGSGGGAALYAVVREEQAQNTFGGTSVATTWTTRVLNTIAFDPSSIVSSLTSNAFTLQAGTYILQVLSPMFADNATRVRIFNQTDSSVVVTGVSQNTNQGNSVYTNAAANCVVTLSGAKALRVEYWAGTAQASNGLGIPTNIASTVEVYTQVEIWKIG